eukprot:TRINITY_DN9852_c0_g4_i2.p1 TRINITY_DN9852_c0_g4~~TRINITY_DN9852_c0_g4_i2.p1  ORF type:complete len:418 (+),score=78.11 TRINITY_DN9852_c0_g4_i2:86-1339(+)
METCRVPLPEPPRLVRPRPGAEALFQQGTLIVYNDEVLNVTNALPDGKWLYCVVKSRPRNGDVTVQALREGWVPTAAVEELTQAEVLEVPSDALLTGKAHYEHLSFAEVMDAWRDQDGRPSTLDLCENDILQLSCIKAKDGWAFGWPLEEPSRRGWFPLSKVKRLEPALESLVRSDRPLVQSATEEIRVLIKSGPLPGKQTWDFEGQLPQVVKDSMAQQLREWKEMMSKMDADEEAAEAARQAVAAAAIVDGNQEDGTHQSASGFAGAAANAALVTESGGDESQVIADIPIDPNNLFNDHMDEELYPLMVCRDAFRPKALADSTKVLLALEVGDLVRSTTLLTAQMLYGFIEGASNRRGWFPRKNMQLLHDPLNRVPAHEIPRAPGGLAAKPALPELPPWLLSPTGPASALSQARGR